MERLLQLQSRGEQVGQFLRELDHLGPAQDEACRLTGAAASLVFVPPGFAAVSFLAASRRPLAHGAGLQSASRQLADRIAAIRRIHLAAAALAGGADGVVLEKRHECRS